MCSLSYPPHLMDKDGGLRREAVRVTPQAVGRCSTKGSSRLREDAILGLTLPTPNLQVDQMFQFSTSDTVHSLGYKVLGHVFAHGKRSERHPTPRGCGQLNKCEPTNLPAHKQCLCWAEVSSWGWECPWGGGGLG